MMFHIVNRIRPTILLLLTIFTSATCRATETVTLQLRWLHQAEFAGFYIAKAKGYYQDVGLNVVINPGKDGKSALHSVLSREADFGVGNSEILVAYSQGLPLVALANIFQRSPSVLITKTSSQIDSLTQLAGKRIMMFSGNEDAEIIAMLTKNGVNINNFHQVKTRSNIDDLIKDKVDAYSAYLTNEPFLLNQQGIETTIFDPTEYGVYFYSDIIFTHQDLATNRHDLVKAFRAASLKGWEYALKNLPETLDVLETYNTGKSRTFLYSELLASKAMIMPELVEMGHMNVTRWQQIADELYQLNIIPKTTINEQFLFPLQEKNNLLQLQPWLNIAGVIFIISLAALSYYSWINHKLKQEINRRIQSEKKAENIARKDMLTGVANRYALIEILHKTINSKALQQSAPALLFIDLDNFKAVNDTFGHQTGDRVLQQFCFRVNRLLRGSAFFARLAGDEFIILMTKSSIDDVDSLMDKITEQAEKPFIIGANTVSIGASIGVTYYRNGDTPEYFLSRADSHMYGNKKRSRQERFTETIKDC
ncbi:GGDEF domain-containing protein [Photobacterium sanguinicancri]|uniref:Thiamine pyrimidine synthase n=1 Tax=Photobacterium sanguinicancri TaxID=875932 RepID=A0AAW7YBS2_9GAMM|nr:GGDEF domain-containing protein [Photobacterium sanguinicancri]MDO6544308.1 ABC transporter substrate-binding protein [Photobacterium sanguinicancri]